MTGESSYAHNYYYYQLALAVHMHITCYAHHMLCTSHAVHMYYYCVHVFQEVHRLNGQLQSTQKHLKTEINSLKEKNNEHKTHLQQQGKELLYVILYYFTFYVSLACLLILALSIFPFSFSLSLSFSEVEIKRLQEEREQLIQELQQSKGTNKQNI